MKPAGEPTSADIDAILPFMSIFERPDFEPGVVVAAQSQDGAPAKSVFEAGPELTRFLQALHEHDWVYDFDWSEWQHAAQRYVAHPELLADAGVGTVRKLLTSHVRKEAFHPGWLAEVAKNGHLAAVLRRLKELRAR